MNELLVERVRNGNCFTEIELGNGTTVRLRPFVYVKKGDMLEFIPSVECFTEVNKVFHESATSTLQKVKIHPPYSRKETIILGSRKFVVTFRERTSSRDWEAVRELERFHYRGKTLNKLVGRRTALLAEVEGYGIVGFGILSATVAAAKPRFELLETDFTTQMKSKLINQIARIPRVVIHPEFRGIGLGIMMARHLVRYAEDYWDVNHFRPIMVEVIAAMTEYHKFFERAGFVKIGYTLGYRNGIVPKYGKGSFEKRTNYESYDFMKDQGPKPYLVFPLNDNISEKIQTFYNKPSIRLLPKRPMLKEAIELKNISVKYKVRNGSTVRTNIIREVFGVDAQHTLSPIFDNFSLRIEPGDVVLITGASGSGKSTLIRLLVSEASDLDDMEIQGGIFGKQIGDIAILDTHGDDSLPIIDQIKRQGDIREAINILNSVGLSEAHLYIKRPNQISDGQRYRFAVAKLCDSGKPIWIADEFASGLNPEMAAVVARGLRKVAYKAGATLIVAAPHIDAFLQAILPNKLVRCRWAQKATVFALTANIEQDGQEVQVLITNSGTLPLTSLQFGLILGNGSFKAIDYVSRLTPQERITIKAKIVDINAEQLYAVAVRTEEGIGEIFYQG